MTQPSAPARTLSESQTSREADVQRRMLLKAASLGAAFAAPLALGIAGCGGGGSSPEPAPAPAPPAPPPTRTWKMGFSGLPPRPDVVTALRGIDMWSMRAELAIIHEELPWTELLGGMSADAILDRDKVQLVQYYRGKGLQLVFMGDLNDGLSRAEEAPKLRALGRSITEPAVQQVYRDYVAAVVRKLRPDYIGLAAETNLIRTAAPASLYAAVVQTANAAVADVRAAGSTAPVFISVQVETAWGAFTQTPFAGIDADLRDFSFTQMLGLSSYPYFAYVQPEDIPADYYSRLLGGRALPAMVVEGGWTSASVGTVSSSPDKQARYITRHAQLLDSVGARGLLQLVFADPDLATFPPPVPPSLPLFLYVGLTDSNFVAKPALANWDALYARRLTS